MKKINSLFLCLCLFTWSVVVLANNKAAPIAEVIKIRGEATQLSPGAKIARKVELGDKFVEDTSVLTGAKSFIKIKFIDNSELNIGPESKIVITEMKKDSVGIISLLKGKIRTEVQKDAKDPNSNKFFIKTRTAALGVRGTDFQTIYNPENKMTSLLTYEGEVAMAKVDEQTYDKLENSQTIKKEIVRDELTKEPKIVQVEGKKMDESTELNKILKSKTAVLVPPGQSAFSSDSLKKSSLPVNINPVQLEALYKNPEFNEKTAGNINLKKESELANTKIIVKTEKQKVAAEGLYNEKTGDFAPRSGGLIDLNSGLYIAPGSDAKLDQKSGLYVPSKIGTIDADTGQYVAPQGLVLDAKKGFVLAEEDKKEKAPELLALREDLNKNIAKDIVVGTPPEEKNEQFNINEKFIRDRMLLSVWVMNQDLKINENAQQTPFYDISAKHSWRFSFLWMMASSNRFSPMVGIDYSLVDYRNEPGRNISSDNEKLMALKFGVQYALTKTYNLYTKVGLHQEHYLDQTGASYPYTYNLKRVVLTRLSVGGNAEFYRGRKFSIDASAEGIFTFRKRINNLIINEGRGLALEVTPKYALKDKTWIGLGLKIENQFQRINGSFGVNRSDRHNGGLELKFIRDF